MRRRAALVASTATAAWLACGCFSSSSSPSSPPALDGSIGDATLPVDGAIEDAPIATADAPAETDAGPTPMPGDAAGDAGAPTDAGSDGPGMSATATGTLYLVSSNANGPIALYPASAAGMPDASDVITGSFLTVPECATADSSGNLYVANISTIFVFAKGATSPTTTLTSPAISGAVKGLAVDKSGNLYVSGGVTVTGVGTTYGVAVFGPDAGTGATPTATFTASSLGFPVGIAVDGSGNVFLASRNESGGDDAILEFAPGATGTATPSRSISGTMSQIGQNGIGGLGVDSAGNVYGTVYQNSANATNRVVVFGPGATSGDQPPTREIVGAATGLATPTGLALDSAGNLYVNNGGTGNGGTVTVYPPGANGNEPPSRTLDPVIQGTPVGAIGIAVGP
jgi:hypothetical protein